MKFKPRKQEDINKIKAISLRRQIKLIKHSKTDKNEKNEDTKELYQKLKSGYQCKLQRY